MTRFSRFAVLSLLGFGPLTLGGCVESDSGGDDGGDTQGDDGADDGVADDAGDDGINDDGGDGADGGDDGPGPAAVADCRDVCDRLLTFDCLVADTHETCYATCPARSEDEIAQFTACVDGTLPGCEGCWENFLDAEPVPPAGDGGDGGDSGTGGSVGEATCEDACEEWLGAGCPAFGEFDSCAGFCASIPESAHDLVVECVESRDGCTLPESCTFEEGGSQGGG